MQKDHYYQARDEGGAIRIIESLRRQGFETRMTSLPRDTPTWKYRVFFWKGKTNGQQKPTGQGPQNAAGLPQKAAKRYGSRTLERTQ